MLNKLKLLKPLIGNTPMWKLSVENINLYTKLEYYNFTGSIKDRPAFYIIWNAILDGKITKDTVVIESSSGNFALSLATICAQLQIKFIAVIDPVINKSSERLLNLICHKVVKVTDVDETGGYLLTRLKIIQSMCQEDPSIYWPNQYHNPHNYLSYFEGLGAEICDYFDNLDFAFIGVSTGGTITGLSLKLKEAFPDIKVIAVDISGSVIFGGAPQKRYLSGIGASFSSPILKSALIDEVVYVSHMDIVDGCEELLSRHFLLTGASSGACYIAAKRYFKDKIFATSPNAVFLCTDKGNGYLESVYDDNWKEWLKQELNINSDK
ncbi:2,3-diaminopropionate biosynthesis protein SbnA [Mucilaginibacter sp. RCC_168]|uniref:2,3-diaminopropionate biosynthesis protein SbnA n=1 Tax=Mucilaginibacter sp. RCC_168 TaxID=3239221 RepID=UPI003526C003